MERQGAKQYLQYDIIHAGHTHTLLQHFYMYTCACENSKEKVYQETEHCYLSKDVCGKRMGRIIRICASFLQGECTHVT